MFALRAKTVYDSAANSYTIPSSGQFSLIGNFLNKSFTPPYAVPNIVNPITTAPRNSKIHLSWSEPNNGGSPITGYTLTYSPGGSTPIQLPANQQSYTVNGLTNGTTYTFIITANNIAGSSAPNPTSDTANYMVSTLAGGADIAYLDGTGSEARFSFPWGVAVDASNNIIMSDGYGAQRIRKVTNPGGVVTTIAGDGYNAPSVGRWLDGIGTSASFGLPLGVAIDNNGDIIVVESLNNRVRKINKTTLQVTTLAGSGSPTFANGTGTSASFNHPQAVCIDQNGDIIVTDWNAHIRKVTNPGGVVTTIAGAGPREWGDLDGPGPSAKIDNINGIALDLNGDIIFTNGGINSGRRIKKLS